MLIFSHCLCSVLVESRRKGGLFSAGVFALLKPLVGVFSHLCLAQVPKTKMFCLHGKELKVTGGGPLHPHLCECFQHYPLKASICMSFSSVHKQCSVPVCFPVREVM
jgi:hypothetical protein